MLGLSAADSWHKANVFSNVLSVFCNRLANCPRWTPPLTECLLREAPADPCDPAHHVDGTYNKWALMLHKCENVCRWCLKQRMGGLTVLFKKTKKNCFRLVQAILPVLKRTLINEVGKCTWWPFFSGSTWVTTFLQSSKKLFVSDWYYKLSLKNWEVYNVYHRWTSMVKDEIWKQEPRIITVLSSLESIVQSVTEQYLFTQLYTNW